MGTEFDPDYTRRLMGRPSVSFYNMHFIGWQTKVVVIMSPGDAYRGVASSGVGEERGDKVSIRRRDDCAH